MQLAQYEQPAPAREAIRVIPLHALGATIALVIGGGLYLVFREETLLFMRGLGELGILASLHGIRTVAASASIPMWVYNSLPDALWAYAYTLISFDSAYGLSGGGRLLAFALPISVTLGSEVAQGFGLLRGTFDPIDLTMLITAVLFATLQSQSTKRK